MSGGSADNGLLDSTEIYRMETSQWKLLEKAKLPGLLWAGRIANVDNVLYYAGGQIDHMKNAKTATDILAWDPDTETWLQTGDMVVPRQAHAMVAVSDPENFCKPSTTTTTTTFTTTTITSATSATNTDGMRSVLQKVDCIPVEEVTSSTGQTETKYPPFIDIFLNPGRSEEKARIVEHQRNISSQYFSRLSLVYSALFRLLWHSSPPCSPQSGLPSLSLLRSCHLAGRQVDCAQLFTKVPTDTGLCCALNTADILKKSEYGRLVQSLQEVTSTAVQNRTAVAQHF